MANERCGAGSVPNGPQLESVSSEGLGKVGAAVTSQAASGSRQMDIGWVAGTVRASAGGSTPSSDDDVAIGGVRLIVCMVPNGYVP